MIFAMRKLAMKDEYDFSKAERGRFHRPGAMLLPPAHANPIRLSAEKSEKPRDDRVADK